MAETLRKLQEYISWPGMRSYVKNYVKGCPHCQQNKIRRRPFKPPLQPVPGPKTLQPFAQISMDLITDLPESGDFDSILSVVHHGLTKGIILIPTTKTANADEIAELLIKHVFTRTGFPDKIISDRDPRFTAKSMEALCKKLNIEHTKSTAYHPQSDGTTECFNQEIEAYLAIYCAQNPTEWNKQLPLIEFTHNSRLHAGRQNTPFELLYGHPLKSFPTDQEPTNNPATDDRIKYLENIREAARTAHEEAQRIMTTRIDAPTPKLDVGQKVWLEARNLPIQVASKKMAARRTGPFPITKKLGPVTYELQLPKSWKIHNRFHVTLLTPVEENDIYGQHFTEPPPDLIKGEEEWEVKAIVKHRTRRGKPEYLVHWKGYPDSERTWQTALDLGNSKEVLDDYKKKNKLR